MSALPATVRDERAPDSRPAAPAYDVRIEENVPAPMRDGTILRADIARPVPRDGSPGGVAETFPVLLTRTPYGKRSLEALAQAGYIAVSQDVRGRFASDGPYEPVHQMCGATIDGQDGYDTTLWAAGLEGSNGRVGVFGLSYPAWEAWELALTRPPPLVALYVSGMSVTSTAVEAVPRPGRRLQWFLQAGAPDVRRRAGLPGPQTRAAADRLWLYERHKWLWFLPWSELPEHVLGPLTPYFKDYLQDPTRDHFRFQGRHGEIDVPVFHRTGWYDRFVSTIDHFTAMRAYGRSDHVRRHQRLLIGPWGHTGTLTRRVGDLDFGPEAEMDDRALMLRWFDHWLKGADTGVLDDPPVRYFVMGLNRWRSAPSWPPPGTRDESFYLHSRGHSNTAAGDGWLSRQIPAADEEPTDAFRYDPRDPVPTIWPLDDQNVPLDHRPLDTRQDVLIYATDPLAQPLEIAGEPILHLYAATTAADTDFIARLCDVHDDGFVQPLCTGIVRARYRAGFDRPQPLTPGATERYRIPLAPIAHRFRPGHRLRLDVTSSDFPNYDRNHNTGRDDFADSTLLVAQQRVHHQTDRPSCLVLPVAPDAPDPPAGEGGGAGSGLRE